MKWLVGLVGLLAIEAHSQQVVIKTGSAPDAVALQLVQEAGQRLTLPVLPSLRHERHVRLFMGPQVLDVWQAPRGAYHAQLLNWVEKVGSKIDNSTPPLFIRSQPLTEPTARALFAVLDSCQLLSLPDDRAIPGWQPMLDGEAYTLEYADSLTHRVATFGNPDAQHGVWQAHLVQQVVTRLQTLSQAPVHWQAFGRKIPYKCYSYNSGVVFCRPVNAAQQRASQRERRRARRQKAGSS